MPAERLSMRKIKEVLRLKWGKGMSNRQIATSSGIGRPTVAPYPYPDHDPDLSLAFLPYPPVAIWPKLCPLPHETHTWQCIKASCVFRQTWHK